MRRESVLVVPTVLWSALLLVRLPTLVGEALSLRRFEVVVVVLVPLLLPPLWLVAPRLTRVPVSPLRTVPTLLPLEPVVLRFT